MSTLKLEPMTAAHWSAVRAIYEAGLATGNATFQTAAPTWAAWDQGHLPHSRLVATDASTGPGGQLGPVLGWAALTPVSSRCVYGGVAEVSVYVAAAAQGQGVGRQLLGALIRASEKAGFWTLQASIFVENTASRRLHAAAGFRTVGHRERIGQLHGRWRDTVLLERRSAVVGAETLAALAV